MRVLVDMNLSPRWKGPLRDAGHDAVWWRDIGPPDATDEVLFQWARDHGHVVLTADLDFGRLLALSGETGPSVILLRLRYTEPPPALPSVLAILARFQEELLQGALVVVDDEGARVRVLPLQ
jgi:predicted nuclease of predicted toxin-antitoxin system